MIHAEVKKNRTVFVILLALILLGTILRIYGLGAKSIWYDEAVSIANAEKDLTFFIDSSFCYKPVYFMLLKIWMSLFGAGKIIARLLSVIFGVISIFLIYRIAKMLFNQKIGLISAFILAISCFHIYHAQQIRQHSLFTLLTLLSFFFFLKIITKPASSHFIFNTLINILILGTHPYGLCVIFLQNLFFFFKIKDRASKRKWYLTQLAVLCCGLWIFIPHKTLIIDKAWWVIKPGFGSLIETFETFSFGGPGYGIGDFKMVPEFIGIAKYLLFIFSVFFILGSISYKNRTTKLSNSSSLNYRLFFLVSWLFVPIGLAFLGSIIYRPVYLIKHLIIASPAYYILIARGIYQFKRLWMQIPILVIISFLTVFPLRIIYGNDFHPHWEGVADYLRESIQEGDVVIISTLKEVVPFMYHFRNKQNGSLRDITLYGKLEQGRYQSIFSEGRNVIIGIRDSRRVLKGESVLNDFVKNFQNKVINQDFFKENRNIWLLVSRWTDERETELILQLMQKYLQKYKLREKIKKRYPGIDLYYYSPES